MNNYATASGSVLRLERRLPGPIERVWQYIVDPEKRALWWVGGKWDLRVGGETQCEWDHRRLSDEPTPDAWKDFDGMTTSGTISRYEPPHVLAYKGDMGMGEFEVERIIHDYVAREVRLDPVNQPLVGGVVEYAMAPPVLVPKRIQ